VPFLPSGDLATSLFRGLDVCNPLIAIRQLAHLRRTHLHPDTAEVEPFVRGSKLIQLGQA
jgi:hypothetical protein